MKVDINPIKVTAKAKVEKNVFLKIVMFMMFLTIVEDCSAMY